MTKSLPWENGNIGTQPHMLGRRMRYSWFPLKGEGLMDHCPHSERRNVKLFRGAHRSRKKDLQPNQGERRSRSLKRTPSGHERPAKGGEGEGTLKEQGGIRKARGLKEEF